MKFVFIDYMDVPDYDCNSPYDVGIGGTQSAICYYAEELAKRQSDVHIVNLNCKEEKQVRGVHFHNPQWLFNNAGQSSDYVIWCSGVLKDKVQISHQLFKDAVTICWIPHNITDRNIQDIESVKYHIDYFAFVSNWQRHKFIQTFNIDPAKTTLMKNGISPAFLGDFEIQHKKPHFLYLSDPTRGLDNVLKGWPDIHAAYPNAELHVYSSKKLYGKQDDESEIVSSFAMLKSLPNAHLHETVGQTELARICREGAFFAYPTNVSETGCIVATEACASGCIPIVSNLGVLGTMFDDCLIYDDTIVSQFVERCKQLLAMYYDEPMNICKIAEQYALYYQNARDYETVVSEFLNNTENLKKYKTYAIQTYKKAHDAFSRGDNDNAIVLYESMEKMFEIPGNAHTYFTNLGVSHFNKGSVNVAIKYFKQAWDMRPTMQLAVNLILSNEKLGDRTAVLEWCEKSIAFGFSMPVVNKVIDILTTKPYFERNKWTQLMTSLWNADIHSNEWMSLYMAHGNMQASDLAHVMKHEQGTNLAMDILHKVKAFMTLHGVPYDTYNTTRENFEKLFSNVLLNMNYWETRNPELHRYTKLYNEHLPRLTDGKSYTFDKVNKNRKIRVGFLSGDICYHPVAYVLNGIIENMDKSKFETFVYSDNIDFEQKNIMQEKIKRECHKFVYIRGKSINESSDLIAADDIDVLIEMTGHTTNGARFPNILRNRPARVIVNYFAYPNTYGIPEMDYKIGDKHVFPVGIEKYYFEKLWKMPSGFHTYKPIVPIDIKRKAHDGIVFGCMNNPKKYRPTWVQNVAKIMKAVAGSKLKMRYYNLEDPCIREFYYKEFEKHGVDRSRLDLDLGNGLGNYFDSYSDVDIVLDPYPYNGGTINIETLYMGIPYVTLLGNNYVSRVGASILHQIGLSELVAKTEEAYYEKAVRLAADRGILNAYHSTLRDRVMNSNLCDGAKFTREFEEVVLGMLHEKKCFL
jgi:predicted O-linked N-acetylglucosamine transferase (SPINDLY family)